jgi:CrcB protein
VIPVAVLLGSGVGAGLRYTLDVWSRHRFGARFPLGTLLVNTLGCLVLGFLLSLPTAAGTAPGGIGYSLLGTGLCGGLTTFSTLNLDTFQYLEIGDWCRAGLNVAANLGSGAIGFALGGWLGFVLSGGR